ncbi:hypothetical protein RHGRI_034718 [Rhododendron griersonianum]|uniref:BZIP domain-containing protein n=1 Tax=Rhododendron griersonianum TaxID=479676 RepID=A0AAV6I5P7_9ERIC|nr:hypothetical protein RHGRI_034718 [Rhododendron griersonianum]
MHSSEWFDPTQPLCTLSRAYMGIHDTPPQSNPTEDSFTHFTTFHKNTSFPNYTHIHPFLHDLSPNTSTHSNNSLNSNSMAATEEKEASASDLRRHRRQLSNRESARRTRLRRKKQIEELQSEKSQLTTTNQKLTEELINLSQCINKIFQENAQLKGEISFLQSFISNQKTPLVDLEEVGFSIA